MNKKFLYILMSGLLVGIVFVLHKPVLSGISLLQDIRGAKLKFIEEEYDFGTIKEGDVVEHVFSFTNIGSDTLIIAQYVPRADAPLHYSVRTEFRRKVMGKLKLRLDPKEEPESKKRR